MPQTRNFRPQTRYSLEGFHFYNRSSFMCALVSIQWNVDDTVVNADSNDDNQISMREVFIWAAAVDSRAGTP